VTGRDKDDLLLFLGTRKEKPDVGIEDLRISCAIRLPDEGEAGVGLARRLAGRNRRKPLSRQELELLIEDLKPDRIYDGPEHVREALLTDPELRQALGRLAVLLEDARAKRGKYRSRRHS
jgi:hypothetical protein